MSSSECDKLIQVKETGFYFILLIIEIGTDILPHPHGFPAETAATPPGQLKEPATLQSQSSGGHQGKRQGSGLTT